MNKSTRNDKNLASNRSGDSASGAGIPGYWSINLEEPPVLVNMGPRAIHGVRGIERYRVRVWAMNCYHEGEGVLTLKGQNFKVGQGRASVTPPNAAMHYEYQGRAVLTWVHFLTTAEKATHLIPACLDLGAEFPAFRKGMQEAAVVLRERPARAQARIWELLWQLSELGDNDNDQEKQPQHPAVAAAVRHIDRHYMETIDIGTLARRLNISQTHLNRLFKRIFGHTISEYLRQRRVAEAKHLLTHTNMPINAIALHTGFSDEHHLNKMMRRYFGIPPSQLRQRHQFLGEI